MPFRVAARTILHLGSELISSDGIAFYELIKNALDAGASRIRVDIVVRLEFDAYDSVLRSIGERRDDATWTGVDDNPGQPTVRRRRWQTLRSQALAAIVEDAPSADELRSELEEATDRTEFLAAIRSANYIDIDDDGEGMSLRTLRDVYLTIGTDNRGRQRRLREQRRLAGEARVGDDRIILGEKGLGRLSAMRLGDNLEVVTGKLRQSHWNDLEIDWNAFADAAEDDLSSVPVAPSEGRTKGANEKGTLIRISGLRAPWTKKKLEDLARDSFAKLADPFESSSQLPLRVTYNGDPVPIPTFADFVLQHAHGVFAAEFRVPENGEPSLVGRMDYRLRNRRSRFTLRGFELATMANGASRDTLRRVGPFRLEVYWFNRRVLTKIEGIGDLVTVRRLLATWAGGVSLYRDGYRVNPYGGPNDDWLDLDRDAFSTSGFKLNRGQIVGRAQITQEGNPYLVDQTNREGLKDGLEKEAFVALLSGVMELQFRQFVVRVDAELARAGRIGPGAALERFREEDDRIVDLLPQLTKALRRTPKGRELSSQVEDALKALREAADQVQLAASAQDQERARVVHLASIGLLIEVLAHELYRATANGLKTIAQTRKSHDEASTRTSLRVLDAQLRTLQKRLQVLDPLSTNARQTREEFELVEWVGAIVEGFASQHRSSNVVFRVVARPRGATRYVVAVKGMFVQVIENLLNNSLFWIEEEMRYRTRGRAKPDSDEPIGLIAVTIEPRTGRVIVADDGPGIPEERRDLVFEPFFSTKKQKQGKGLGLYVAREIAELHGGRLHLGPADEDGNINSVIFEIGNVDGD